MFPRTRTTPLLIALLVAVPAAVSAAPAAAAEVVARAASVANDGDRVVRLTRTERRSLVGVTVVYGGKRRKLRGAAVRRAARQGVIPVRTRGRARRLRVVLRLDRVAPVTRIRSRSGDRSRTTISFDANEASSFSCRINGARWRSCRSPLSFRPAGDGPQKVHVRATDRAGNVDPTPATTEWTPAPAPASAPAPGANPAVRPSKPAPNVQPVPEASAPVGGSTQQPAGFEPLSDADAAGRVVRSPFEPRPENAGANQRTPTEAELAVYRAARTGDHFCDSKLDLKVTGNFTGTTDEILQWAAFKWGLDVEVLRSVAVVESWWRQSAGDHTGGGLMSIVWDVHRGTFPLGRDSTAFNVDFFGAIIRHYYDGCASWLNNVERGSDYGPGDIWGAVGAWYAGRWHTDGATWYINRIKGTVAERTWAGSGF